MTAETTLPCPMDGCGVPIPMNRFMVPFVMQIQCPSCFGLISLVLQGVPQAAEGK